MTAFEAMREAWAAATPEDRARMIAWIEAEATRVRWRGRYVEGVLQRLDAEAEA